MAVGSNDGKTFDRAYVDEAARMEEAFQEQLQDADPHGMSVDLEEAIAERRAYDEQLRRLTHFIAAKRIKKRRRKLGRNGFSIHKMAVPKSKPYRRSRNSA